MQSVTLIAQPRSKYPFLKTGPLKTGKYVAKTSGTFGLLWFTDFGEKFWEACTTVDDNAKLRLRTSGFDEMNWSISFRFGGYKARLSAMKYKGLFGTPSNSLIEVKLGSNNPNDLKMFLQALATKFETPPWILNNWKKAEAKTGFSRQDILDAWSNGMGRKITKEESEIKGWMSSLFSSKSKDEPEKPIIDDEDVEIFENDEGEEVRMKIHGALEVEGIEYAIMSYADSFNPEFEIMKMERKKGGDVSYSNVDDDDLYDDLSNAAAKHLEAMGVI